MTRLIVEADGGSRGNPGPAGYGALVREESGTVRAERGGYLGVSTNNVAEYSGLVAGLRAAAEIDAGAEILVRMDSRLVVEQMSGRWQIRHDALRRLAGEARAAFAGQVTYEWVPRAQNAAADKLANEAMDTGSRIVRDFPPAGTGGSAAQAGTPSADTGGTGGRAPTLGADDAESPAFDTPARPSGAAVRFDGAEPLTLVLVRHGQTPMTVAGRLSGSSVAGPGLTPQGRTQAARLADLVARIGIDAWPDLPRPSQVIASPMVRTRETASAVGRRLGLPVDLDDRFAEVHFGEWEGLTAAEVDEGWPGRFASWHLTGTLAPPGGESYADVGTRVWHGLEDLVAAGVGRTVVVVGHAIQVRAAVGTALGAPPARWHGLRVPPASATILRLWADGTAELTASGVPGGL